MPVECKHRPGRLCQLHRLKRLLQPALPDVPEYDQHDAAAASPGVVRRRDSSAPVILATGPPDEFLPG